MYISEDSPLFSRGCLPQSGLFDVVTLWTVWPGGGNDSLPVSATFNMRSNWRSNDFSLYAPTFHTGSPSITITIISEFRLKLKEYGANVYYTLYRTNQYCK